MSYYILQNDETKGPYTLGQLRGMWNSGALTTETLHCQEGDSDWQPLSAILHELEPPPAPRHILTPPPAAAYSPPLPHHESGSKRSSRHNKAIGAVLMCISIPGCIASASSPGEPGIGMLIWTAAFFIGIALFIVGRFQE